MFLQAPLLMLQALGGDRTLQRTPAMVSEALADVERILQSKGTSLKRFPGMLDPPAPVTRELRLIEEQLLYNTLALQQEVTQQLPGLNADQRHAFDAIMAVVSKAEDDIQVLLCLIFILSSPIHVMLPIRLSAHLLMSSTLILSTPSPCNTLFVMLFAHLLACLARVYLAHQSQGLASKWLYTKLLNTWLQDGELRQFFIDGPGGTGKTHLYKVFLAQIRGDAQIALAMASSGLAALLMAGGTTAHNRLKIPIDLDESSKCK